MRVWISGTILKAEALGADPRELICLAALMSVYVDNPVIPIDVDGVNEEELTIHQIRISRSRLPKVIQEQWKDASDSELAKWLKRRVEDYILAYKKEAANQPSSTLFNQIAPKPTVIKQDNAEKKRFDPSRLRKKDSKSEVSTKSAMVEGVIEPTLKSTDAIQAELPLVPEQIVPERISEETDTEIETQSSVNSLTIINKKLEQGVELTYEEKMELAMANRKKRLSNQKNEPVAEPIEAKPSEDDLIKQGNQFADSLLADWGNPY